MSEYQLPPLPPQVPAATAMLRAYGTLARMAIINGFQYRTSQYLYMFGMLTEPIIYLVIWSTVARAQGGEVAGFTPGGFAAYYIVWTLVRNMNIVFTPFGWEERIREGRLSGQLLRPLHPIHYDLGFFMGWKVVIIVLWLPIAFVLSLLFQPDLSPRPTQIVAFCVAVWGAYFIRSLLLWMLGMVTFWTTRIAGAFELYFAAELLLSGRVVPIRLMPDWVQQIAQSLPFESTFGFPIIALVGPVSDRELVEGLIRQAVWVAIGVAGVQVMWRRAIKRYTAVSG